MLPRTRSPWRRLLRDRSGVAAVEMALVGPVLALASILMIDFAYAFHAQLKLTSAVTAASQYAFQEGRDLSAADVPAFNERVVAIVVATATLSSVPTVTVTFNGVSDGSRAADYYCLAGSPPVWTSTSTTVAGCGGGVSSGRFVTIEATASEATLFPGDTVLGSAIHLVDQAIVRVQ